MLNEEATLADLVEEERKRARKKPPTPKQRARERASRRWGRNLCHVWNAAHLLTDEEIAWLVQVTDATHDKPARSSRKGDDAMRLDKLCSSLWRREWEARDRLRRQQRQELAERMRSMGLQTRRISEAGRVALNIETYWTIVPLVGLCITIPVWLWLRLTRPRKPRPGE
jgi:hypothetical protein